MTLDLVRLTTAHNTSVVALEYAARRPRNVSLVVGHGYSSSKHNLDGLCGFLASHGYTVLSVDFPGHKLGASGGTLRGLDDCVAALQAAVAYARERHGPSVHVIGHSMGAMTALRVAAVDRDLAGAVAIATGWGRLAALDALQKRGVTDLRASYVDGATLPQIMADVEASNECMIAGLGNCPLLFVAAERDMMVTPQSVRELYDRAPVPKSFEMIDSDHTFAGERARSVVLAWLNAIHPRTSEAPA